MVAHHSTGIGLVTRFPATAPATSHFLGGRALRRALPLHFTVACHCIGIGLVTRFPTTAPATSHFIGGLALRRALPLNITVARHGIGIGFVTRFPAMAPATSHFLGGRGHGPPLLPPPHPPHPPPPPPHSCAPRPWHWLGYPIPRHGTRYLTLPRGSRTPACAPTQHRSCAPRHRHRLCHPVPRHGTHYLTLPRRLRAPACSPTQHRGCAPGHRHRLCHPVPRHVTRYLTLPRRSRAWPHATTTSSTSSTSSTSTSRLRATAPASAWLPDSPPRHPLPHISSAVTGLVPRYYHLLHLLHLLHLHLTVARHGTGIGLVTRFPATAPTPSHFLGGRALRRSLPPHLFRGRALRRLLPHTFSAGSRFGVCCFSTSPMAAASAPFKLNDTTTDFNECTRFSLLTSCVLCLSISLVRLLLLADGKDGSPMGVVWRGGAHKTCSVKAH